MSIGVDVGAVVRRSPQEKKALSYAKDRRNDYGQHDKASRRSIRRNKRTPNRADRHRERQLLATATGCHVPVGAAEQAESRLLAKKSMWMTKRWRKSRDASLGEFVVWRLRRRAEVGIAAPADVETRIERIRRRIA